MTTITEAFADLEAALRRLAQSSALGLEVAYGSVTSRLAVTSNAIAEALARMAERSVLRADALLDELEPITESEAGCLLTAIPEPLNTTEAGGPVLIIRASRQITESEADRVRELWLRDRASTPARFSD